MTNRLSKESSPYLRLHAENPVDWYAWGEEAFGRARAEDKPIFLSVGYSTCYWCHVMERESFSSPAIAERLNQGFVSIKLDREERPDLDEIYMMATQLLTRSGGWPNSLFLTHDLKPFYAGTYFPPDDRSGRPGFPRVLAAVREAWESRRESALEQAEAVAEAMATELGARRDGGAGLPGIEVIQGAQTALARRFDGRWGGFGHAPKFPSPANLEFLLLRASAGDGPARDMLVKTLDGMARGGIHDQIGGGFHRYSTDAEWLVPHFEKMLYDNAALGLLYAEAAPLAPEAGFDRVARRTLDFVLAELTGTGGAFLSAIDAETDGEEGAYYTWTREDLRHVLGDSAYPLLAEVFGFDGPENFEGRGYVLCLPLSLGERAQGLGVSVAELLARLEPGRSALLAARWNRKRPLVDDKVLTDWNGLMIGAMARAGSLLGEARYLEAARRAADFILSHLSRGPSPRLCHVYRDGIAKVDALLDDYAFLVRGLLDLHGADGQQRWLQEAERLVAEQEAHLADGATGGYFSAPEDPRLLFRARAAHDGAVVSGNGTAARNLLKLARVTGNHVYARRAAHVIGAFGPAVSEFPLGHVTLITALAEAPASIREEPSGGKGRALAEGLVQVEGILQEAAGQWLPFTVSLRIPEGWHVNANPAGLASLVPLQVEGASGSVRGVEYPEGKLLSSGSEDSPRVYRGNVVVQGEIERGPRPSLTVTYQACDDDRCLAPVSREVPLRTRMS